MEYMGWNLHTNWSEVDDLSGAEVVELPAFVADLLYYSSLSSSYNSLITHN